MANALRITIVKADKLKAKVKRIVPEVEKTLQRETLEAATEVKDQAVAEIQKPKSGELYRRRRRNRGQFIQWRASAPGEAPAKKTGENLARIKAKKNNRAGKPGAKIQAPGIYRLLERGLGNIAPRPLFGPLLREYRSKFKDKLDDSVRKSLGVVVRK